MKIFSILLTFFISLSLIGCGSSGSEGYISDDADGDIISDYVVSNNQISYIINDSFTIQWDDDFNSVLTLKNARFVLDESQETISISNFYQQYNISGKTSQDITLNLNIPVDSSKYSRKGTLYIDYNIDGNNNQTFSHDYILNGTDETSVTEYIIEHNAPETLSNDAQTLTVEVRLGESYQGLGEDTADIDYLSDVFIDYEIITSEYVSNTSTGSLNSTNSAGYTYLTLDINENTDYIARTIQVRLNYQNKSEVILINQSGIGSGDENTKTYTMSFESYYGSSKLITNVNGEGETITIVGKVYETENNIKTLVTDSLINYRTNTDVGISSGTLYTDSNGEFYLDITIPENDEKIAREFDMIFSLYNKGFSDTLTIQQNSNYGENFYEYLFDLSEITSMTFPNGIGGTGKIIGTLLVSGNENIHSGGYVPVSEYIDAGILNTNQSISYTISHPSYFDISGTGDIVINNNSGIFELEFDTTGNQILDSEDVTVTIVFYFGNTTQSFTVILSSAASE